MDGCQELPWSDCVLIEYQNVYGHARTIVVLPRHVQVLLMNSKETKTDDRRWPEMNICQTRLHLNHGGLYAAETNAMGKCRYEHFYVLGIGMLPEGETTPSISSSINVRPEKCPVHDSMAARGTQQRDGPRGREDSVSRSLSDATRYHMGFRNSAAGRSTISAFVDLLLRP